MHRKNSAPNRSVTDVGKGDYVKVGGSWHKVLANTAHGSEHTPRSWTVKTDDGKYHDMYRIELYAKQEDME